MGFICIPAAIIGLNQGRSAAFDQTKTVDGKQLNDGLTLHNVVIEVKGAHWLFCDADLVT